MHLPGPQSDSSVTCEIQLLGAGQSLLFTMSQLPQTRLITSLNIMSHCISSCLIMSHRVSLCLFVSLCILAKEVMTCHDMSLRFRSFCLAFSTPSPWPHSALWVSVSSQRQDWSGLGMTSDDIRWHHHPGPLNRSAGHPLTTGYIMSYHLWFTSGFARISSRLSKPLSSFISLSFRGWHCIWWPA